jgi:hypothetical protein
MKINHTPNKSKDVRRRQLLSMSIKNAPFRDNTFPHKPLLKIDLIEEFTDDL